MLEEQVISYLFTFDHQCQASCLALSKLLINSCWMNESMNKWMMKVMFFHTTSPTFKLRSLSGFQGHLYFKRWSNENSLALRQHPHGHKINQHMWQGSAEITGLFVSLYLWEFPMLKSLNWLHWAKWTPLFSNLNRMQAPHGENLGPNNTGQFQNSCLL